MGQTLFCMQFSVKTETSGLWEGLTCMKEEWKFAGMKHGALSVMNRGQPMMPMWSVDS